MHEYIQVCHCVGRIDYIAKVGQRHAINGFIDRAKSNVSSKGYIVVVIVVVVVLLIFVQKNKRMNIQLVAKGDSLTSSASTAGPTTIVREVNYGNGAASYMDYMGGQLILGE